MENPVASITQCLLLSPVLSSINQSISCRLARQKEITAGWRQYIKMITLVSCIHVLQCCIIIREVMLLFLALSRHVSNKEFFFSFVRQQSSKFECSFLFCLFFCKIPKLKLPDHILLLTDYGGVVGYRRCNFAAYQQHLNFHLRIVCLQLSTSLYYLCKCINFFITKHTKL